MEIKAGRTSKVYYAEEPIGLERRTCTFNSTYVKECEFQMTAADEAEPLELNIKVNGYYYDRRN